MKKFLVIILLGLLISQPLSAYQGNKYEGTVAFYMYDKQFWFTSGGYLLAAEYVTTEMVSLNGSHYRYIAASGSAKNGYVGHRGRDSVTGSTIYTHHYHIVGSTTY